MTKQVLEQESHHYVGRFAPSPTGPLHFGSLVCALASYLDARAQNGRWLVRMEDIDPPREQAGASDEILRALEAHGLEWDGEVLFQSTRSEAYYAALNLLTESGLCYRCACTRKRLADLNGNYDGHCLQRPPPSNTPSALRLNYSALRTFAPELAEVLNFHDRMQGEIPAHSSDTSDFVVHRKDGLFAYQLAVVVDDIAQKVTHVVRGNDLLETTAKQRLLFAIFEGHIPSYAHVPVVVNTAGDKLSKQNHAPGIETHQASINLWRALSALGMQAPTTLRGARVHELLAWGIAHWQPANLEGKQSVQEDQLPKLV